MHLIWRQLADGNTVVNADRLRDLVNQGHVARPAPPPKDMDMQDYYELLLAATNAAWSN